MPRRAVESQWRYWGIGCSAWVRLSKPEGGGVPLLTCTGQHTNLHLWHQLVSGVSISGGSQLVKWEPVFTTPYNQEELFLLQCLPKFILWQKNKALVAEPCHWLSPLWKWASLLLRYLQFTIALWSIRKPLSSENSLSHWSCHLQAVSARQKEGEIQLPMTVSSYVKLFTLKCLANPGYI